MPVPDTTTFELHDVVNEINATLEGAIISSTSDNGGIARFNTTDTGTLVVGSDVKVSVTAYGTTWNTVTAISVDSWFECGIAYISFGGGTWYGSGSLGDCFNNSFGPCFDLAYAGNFDKLYNFRNYNHALGSYTTVVPCAPSGRVTRNTGDRSGDRRTDWNAIRLAANADSSGSAYLVETNVSSYLYDVEFVRTLLTFDLSSIPATAVCRDIEFNATGNAYFTSNWGGGGTDPTILGRYFVVVSPLSPFSVSYPLTNYNYTNWGSQIFNGLYTGTSTTFDWESTAGDRTYFGGKFGDSAVQMYLIAYTDFADDDVGFADDVGYMHQWDINNISLKITWGAPPY